MSAMLVVDYEKSERGPQRRKSGDGRQLHCCCICGALDVWRDSWTTYCSWKEIDDEAPIPKFCSDQCRAKGGPEARDVTPEMKRRAKDAEWRDPEPAYREATEREKYNLAADVQNRRPTRERLADNPKPSIPGQLGENR